MQSSRIELLQAMSIFGGVRDDIVHFILERAPVVALAAGEYFFREGDAPDSMFVLESGTAAVEKESDARLIRTVGPGGCFGEMSLIDFAPRSASVRAIDDCRALRISNACLHDVYERDVEQFAIIEMNMGREVTRRLRELDAAVDAKRGGPRLP